jgi:hypothetical protein
VKYTPQKFNTQELIEIFPEAKRIIPIKIKAFETERAELMDCMQDFQHNAKHIAKQEKKDELFVWFWVHAFIKYFYAPKIVEFDRCLIMLRMQARTLKLLGEGKASLGNHKSVEAWEELKQRARDADIETVTADYLSRVRRYGNQIKALCPLHQEKTPSFVIYLDSNQYHCFGCQKHGDVISFLMEMESIGFKEAVMRLSS